MANALVLSDAPLAVWERDYQRRFPPVTDEALARSLAVAFDEGAYLASQRAVAWFRRELAHAEAPLFVPALERATRPDYAAIRDYLTADCNVHPIVAARVALWLTKYQTRS